MARSVEAVWLTVPVNEHDHWQGSWNANLMLVEYGDYQCSHCGKADRIVRQLQERLGDRMLYVFRNFPLTKTHPHAEHAAQAAEAAGAQGLFWEMHDVLFQHQDRLEDGDLEGYARMLELDGLSFSHALREQTHAPRVRQDARNGLQSGVKGTPTFFLNGRRYDGPVEFDAMLAALEAADR